MVSLFGKRADFLAAARTGRLNKKNPTIAKGLQARERLVREHIKLVYHVTNKRKFYTCSYEELVQAGTLGLLRAIESFNPTLGFKFSTHAVGIIRREVAGASKDERVIRIPSNVLQKMTKVKNATLHEDAHSIFQTAKGLGYTEKMASLITFHWREPVSLDCFPSDVS